MKPLRPRWAPILCLVTGFAAFGCGDLPTHPSQDGPGSEAEGPLYALVDGAPMEVFTWSSAAKDDLTRSAWIGEEGGEIHLQWPGIRLVVPEGAMPIDAKNPQDAGKIGAEARRISMTVLKGKGLAVQFSPHGLKFDRPVRLIIDLAWTEAGDDEGTMDDLIGVYFEGAPKSMVDGLEVLPVSVDDGTLTMELHHFSGYLLASG